MLISELMASDLAIENKMTRSVLSKIPADKFDWKPNDELQSISWNANHVVEIVGWLPGILQQSEWDIAPVGGEGYTPNQATTTEDILHAFDTNCKAALEALKGVPDSVMDEVWSLKMGGHVLFTMKKGDCLRKWVFGHIAHHRGILSVYLRMAGVKLSSIYEE